MGETKIILISRQWPKALLQKFQESLGLKPRPAGHKLLRYYGLTKKDKENRKA